MEQDIQTRRYAKLTDGALLRLRYVLSRGHTLAQAVVATGLSIDTVNGAIRHYGARRPLATGEDVWLHLKYIFETIADQLLTAEAGSTAWLSFARRQGAVRAGQRRFGAGKCQCGGGRTRPDVAG